MKGHVGLLRAMAARVRRPKPAAAAFNAPPIFPTDALLAPSAELAVPASAQPVPGLRRINADNPYNAADATLHIGDTVVPVQTTALDAEWELAPRCKSSADRTVLGIDGDVIVAGTVAEDGTVTVVTPTAQQPVLRRGGPPNNCPCTAIYSSCRCPASP